MRADLGHRLRALFRRDTVERELDEELRLHLEHEIEKRLAAGMGRDEAIRQAHLALGGFDQIREAHRDARGISFVESVLQDLRYGGRTMRRAPLFAMTAVATIALSTAAIATVLTLAHTLFVQRLPVQRPSELVAVSGTRIRWNPERLAVREAERVRILGPVSYPDYVSFRDRTRTLSGLAAHYPTAPLFVTANGNVKEINGAAVSANFFRLLGLEPVLGRFFHEPEDQVPDRDRVAVISSNLWRTWFAASPDAVGSHLRINSVDFTIVGIAASDFVGTTPVPIEVYIPTMMLRVGYRWCDDALAADCSVLQMIGRLAPGQTVASAAAEMPTLMPASWLHARAGENSGVAVTDVRGMSEDDDEPRLVAMLAAVAFLLLAVCCANLAGLSTAQSAARAGEFAIRLSLGAGARRVVRQVSTEWLMVGAAGGIGGVVLSRLFIGMLAAAFFTVDDEGHPLRYLFGQPPAIAAITIGAALVAALVISVGPALRVARRTGVSDATPRSTAARRIPGAWLLGVQAAAAVAMVSVAALLAAGARTMVTGRNYDATHLAVLRVRPRLLKYPPERAQRFQRDVVQRLAAVPSVESVSMVGVGTVLNGGATAIALPSWTGQQVRARFNEIGPDYFATLQTPLISGREFDAGDVVSSPHVAVVNQTLAARLWPDGQALGATLLVSKTPHRVVGIVEDIRLGSRAALPESWVYTPFWQNPAEIDSRLAIRIAGDPAAMLPALVREVNRVDPDVPISEAITMPIQLEGLMRPARIGAAFVGYTAALAVLLTGIGLFGVLSFAVARRTREIGIRMALGAARARIVRAIVRDGLLVVGSGAVAGIGAAQAATRLVTHLLYGSAAADWLYYVAAAALVVIVGASACIAPARRAAGVEPAVALRSD
ncbi:MAG TPA: ABC transporter permease [Vicinamibacterales bacterium]|nr:ABC transporter permease [Vicinamibacterales bacterium]